MFDYPPVCPRLAPAAAVPLAPLHVLVDVATGRGSAGYVKPNAHVCRCTNVYYFTLIYD
ncbi:hypothetical protein QCA50_017131 [Cerrena zonata]|uniref:Uncharacterized protein n=1 Tax=Cerrena zonata TaxID=2478898 RepID=A0AAW0FLC3_9APHY